MTYTCVKAASEWMDAPGPACLQSCCHRRGLSLLTFWKPDSLRANEVLYASQYTWVLNISRVSQTMPCTGLGVLGAGQGRPCAGDGEAPRPTSRACVPGGLPPLSFN